MLLLSSWSKACVINIDNRRESKIRCRKGKTRVEVISHWIVHCAKAAILRIPNMPSFTFSSRVLSVKSQKWKIFLKSFYKYLSFFRLWTQLALRSKFCSRSTIDLSIGSKAWNCIRWIDVLLFVRLWHLSWEIPVMDKSIKSLNDKDRAWLNTRVRTGLFSILTSHEKQTKTENIRELLSREEKQGPTTQWFVCKRERPRAWCTVW